MNRPHTLLAVLLAMTLCVVAHAHVAINGKPAVADLARGLLLCTVPESEFGTDFTATITLADSVLEATIGGMPVGNDPIVVPSLSGDTRLHIDVLCADSTRWSGELQFTFLPIVNFGGTFNRTTYEIVPFDIVQPVDADVHESAKVRYRGSLSYYGAREKRGYHVKFVDANGDKLDIKLFGLRNDNSWVLDGGGCDNLRIRNRVCADLWNDFGAKPYYADEEPQARSAVRGQLVEMFIDGDYRGVYNMSEAMDRKTMKLKKYDENTLEIHGQLWKADDRSPITLMDSVPPTMPNGRLARYNNFETKYPDLDEVKPTNYDLLYNLGKLCVEADDSTFAADIGRLLDLPVLLDSYIFLQTLLAFDNEGKNVYYACYDRAQSPMLTLGLWDFDVSFGQSWTSYDMHPDYTGPWHSLYTDFINHHRYLCRIIDLDVDGFNERAIERYHELRQDVLATDAIIARFDNSVDMLNRCGVARREMWRFEHDVFLQHAVDINAEMEFIRQWTEQHMTYLDDCVFVENPPAIGDATRNGTIDIDDINAIINMITNRTDKHGSADANRDQIIDIDDVNIVINIILQSL